MSTGADVLLDDTAGRAAPRGLRPLRVTRARLRRDAGSVGLGSLGLAVVLGLWWLVSLQLGPLRLPDPWRVADAIWRNWHNIPQLQYIVMRPGGLGDALQSTVVSVVTTVSIGVVAGAIVGIAMSYVVPLRVVLTPVLLVLGTTPVLILLPFLVQWFGNGRFVFSGLVVVFTFVVIATVTTKSIANAAGKYNDYARSLGAGPRFEMIHVALPALVPDLVAGARVSLAAGWSLQTVGELMGGKAGAGRVIGAMANVSDTTLVLAMVACLALSAVAIDAAIAFLARRTQRWQA